MVRESPNWRTLVISALLWRKILAFHRVVLDDAGHVGLDNPSCFLDHDLQNILETLRQSPPISPLSNLLAKR